MVADKAKKPKIVEKTEEEDSDQIDGELVLCIEKLQEVQDELEKVNDEASEKVLEVEQKYNEIRRPVYVKRAEIIKGIPDFWLTAFMSHPMLADVLSEEDQKIFKHLSSLDVEDFKDLKSGYSITFHFNSNPYFEDTKLTKTFSFSDEGTTKITGTTINWKEGMGIANGENNEKKGSKRPLVVESFFTWFSETGQSDLAEGQSDLHDEIAELIKDELWPNPLRYFNNDADEDFDGDEDDDEEKGVDVLDDDDDEQDGEDEDGDEDDGEDN
ncbi:hypothetical protein AQUCO_00600286v1 [Aquilegia coerulea]|uniref:NAP1-related protein 2 n=1 Tax=Aquilegia coerulea TaxID=218851 RepID=A0A2G5ENZ1_AQUCA|nr:hypothetical protein AQUCO_00600286v1 [Aquilegia coerulea]